MISRGPRKLTWIFTLIKKNININNEKYIHLQVNKDYYILFMYFMFIDIVYQLYEKLNLCNNFSGQMNAIITASVSMMVDGIGL
jgi:hypothetical protein